MAVPSASAAVRLTAQSASVRQLRDRLAESLRLRLSDIPVPPAARADSDTRVAVLFSGGLDCTVLARMSHDLLPPEQGVDLLNAAFENPRIAAQLAKQPLVAADIYEACPDRITGRKSFAELQRVCPGRAWRFIAVRSWPRSPQPHSLTPMHSTADPRGRSTSPTSR